MHSRKSAFTLIELLVVIAIIAVLAAILFPVFTQVRETGRQASCVQNMKQLGLGFRMYVDEYHTFPCGGPIHRSIEDRLNRGEWVVCRLNYSHYSRNTMDITGGSLFKYVKNTKIYMCPSDLHAVKKLDGVHIFGLSYSMNNLFDHLPESELRSASKTVLLIDEGAGSMSGVAGIKGTICDGYFGYNGLNGDMPADVHLGGCNFAFADSHVESKKHLAYSSLWWSPTTYPRKLN